MWSTTRYDIEEYKAPTWTQGFKVVPVYRMKLASTPTPIQEWHLLGVPEGIEIFVKRDDMTGSTLTGSKVRKMEFLLADAIKKGYKNVITLGAAQSNHVRTTVLAAREAGLDSHVILKTNVESIEDLPLQGNLLLSLLGGAHVYIVPDNKEFYDNMDHMMKKLAQEIKDTTGVESYTIPLGASTSLGIYGIFEAFDEMIRHGLKDNVTDIVMTCGSGGTIAGVAIANYLISGDRIRIHGFCVTRNGPDFFYSHLDHTLQELGLTHVKSRHIAHISSCTGLGYGINTEQETEFISNTCANTGIVIDGTYTGKAAYAMVQELKKNPSKFKGSRILFFHTGGMFANLVQGKADALIQSSNYKTKCKIWNPN